MILGNTTREVRLKARLFTAGSGSLGIEVLTTKLEKTEALLLMPVQDQPAIPRDAREVFTLNVELPSVHPFGRRCIHCQCTLSSATRVPNEMWEVAIAIKKMRFIPQPLSSMQSTMSSHSAGSELIQ
jgi:hypothetical protein